jgi:hypothetical protein
LFTLVLRAKERTNLAKVIRINEEGLTPEAYDQRLRRGPIALRFGELETTAFELFQNRPNPFVERTTIPFYLPEAGRVLLRINDVSGRTVYQTNGDFPSGYQQFEIDGQAIPSGVFYYTVQTESGQLTRKLVHTR